MWTQSKVNLYTVMDSECVQHSCAHQARVCGTQVPHTDVAIQLQEMGFERGWGDTVGRIRETMHLLAEIVQAPDPESLQVCILNPAYSSI